MQIGLGTTGLGMFELHWLWMRCDFLIPLAHLAQDSRSIRTLIRILEKKIYIYIMFITPISFSGSIAVYGPWSSASFCLEKPPCTGVTNRMNGSRASSPTVYPRVPPSTSSKGEKRTQKRQRTID